MSPASKCHTFPDTDITKNGDVRPVNLTALHRCAVKGSFLCSTAYLEMSLWSFLNNLAGLIPLYRLHYRQWGSLRQRCGFRTDGIWLFSILVSWECIILLARFRSGLQCGKLRLLTVERHAVDKLSSPMFFLDLHWWNRGRFSMSEDLFSREVEHALQEAMQWWWSLSHDFESSLSKMFVLLRKCGRPLLVNHWENVWQEHGRHSAPYLKKLYYRHPARYSPEGLHVEVNNSRLKPVISI